MKKKPKKTFSFKLDPKIVASLERKGFNVAQEIRDSLTSLNADDKCPTCGQEMSLKVKLNLKAR